METALRTALVNWISSDPLLRPSLNSIAEEAPSRASPPWLGIAASASTDWSTKGRKGREVRIALELRARGDEAGATADLVSSIEARIESMPPAQTGFRIVTTTFLRARAEQRPRNTRAVLLEYRFRLIEN